MNVRFYIDPDTEEPHIYKHGIREEEVFQVLQFLMRIVQAKKIQELLWGRHKLAVKYESSMSQTQSPTACLS